MKLPLLKTTAQIEAEINFKRTLIDFLTQQLPSLILASTLFVGGIILLALHLPGWSIFLGLPAVQIGLIFIIFSFDNTTKKKTDFQNYYSLSCKSCGRAVFAPIGQKEIICENCQKKILKKKGAGGSNLS